MTVGEEIVAGVPTVWASVGLIAEAVFAWIKAPVAFLLPIPGLIAFTWAWKDRKNRIRAESPYARWEIYPLPENDGWYMSEIAIMNRWDEPLKGRKVRISGIRACRMRHHSAPSTEEGVKSMDVVWWFRSAQDTPGSGVSGATLLFIKLPYLVQDGIAPSGTGGRLDSSIRDKIEKLQLTINLTSASNRKIRCVAQPTIMSDTTHNRYGRTSTKEWP